MRIKLESIIKRLNDRGFHNVDYSTIQDNGQKRVVIKVYYIDKVFQTSYIEHDDLTMYESYIAEGMIVSQLLYQIALCDCKYYNDKWNEIENNRDHS